MIEEHIKRTRTLSGLDAYGLRLANQGHSWIPSERRAFDRRARELKRKEA